MTTANTDKDDRADEPQRPACGARRFQNMPWLATAMGNAGVEARGAIRHIRYGQHITRRGEH